MAAEDSGYLNHANDETKLSVFFFKRSAEFTLIRSLIAAVHDKRRYSVFLQKRIKSDPNTC